MKIVAWIVGLIAVVLTGFMLFTAGWERPPIDSEQSGFRGTGMAEVSNPRIEGPKQRAQLDQVPESSPLTSATMAGPKAGDVYQNVQVLDDLSIAQFNRLMQAITEWVSPEEGCGYCHNLNNLADDSVYTKNVTRSMIQMTQSINADWDSHVVETGVTCYTCHRGQNVPQYAWFNGDPAADSADGMGGWRAGQNRASPQVGLASLPEDPFTKYLDERQEIRVLGQEALPNEESNSSIQETEASYALMIHMSTSLGVNCTYCHNSRAFGQWEQSTPQRTTAYHGIRMVQAVNADYVKPLSSVLPPHRLGPTGEGQKVNCETCHQGVNKPLYGQAMAKDYPSLSGGASGQSEASRAEEGGDEIAADVVALAEDGQASAEPAGEVL